MPTWRSSRGSAPAGIRLSGRRTDPGGAEGHGKTAPRREPASAPKGFLDPSKEAYASLEGQRRIGIFPILFFLGLAAALWWFFARPPEKVHDENAKPRAVVARGDLAEDEKTAVEIFRNVSRSVVYISSIELRRDFFTLNVYEIPKGTGSGFVWDRDGRIVTNFHVIEVPQQAAELARSSARRHAGQDSAHS